ncbi:MAG: vWA domain-containing protein [Candidatus Promineifilaceae bacterium]
MTFIWPWMLLTLLLLPLFVGLYFRLLERRARIAAGLGPLGILPDAQSRGPSFRRRATPILFLLALALLLFSLARPELPVRLPVVQGTVILAFDVSNSMAANDLEPTRMEAAKAAARRFVENQPDTVDIGVVAFSDGGLVVQEPTDDQPAVLATIDRLSPQGATSIGHGIFSALNSIAGEALALDVGALEDGAQPVQIGSFGSAVILLLTDGENTESLDPLRIAQLAAEAGVRIYTVGIGSPEGIILEVDGFNVLTQLNEPVLEEIASLTNGAYYHAEDEAALQEIYENIDLQLTTKGEKMEITALLAGASLLFLLVGGALSLVWYGRIP